MDKQSLTMVKLTIGALLFDAAVELIKETKAATQTLVDVCHVTEEEARTIVNEVLTDINSATEECDARAKEYKAQGKTFADFKKDFDEEMKSYGIDAEQTIDFLHDVQRRKHN